MVHRSPFRVVPARRKAPPAAMSAKPKPQNHSVEHRIWGVGNLLHVRPLDDGSLVAVVAFNGVDRTIRLSADYFITPIPEIMALAPHLSPPPALKVVKKAKVSNTPDEGEDSEPELSENTAEIDQDEPDMVAEP